MADGPSAQYKVFMPYSGGLLTAVDPIIADPNTLSQADNIVFTSSASRRKRPGQVRFNTATLSTSSSLVYGTDYWATVSNAKRAAAVVCRANASTSTAGVVYRSISWVSSSFSNMNTITLKIEAGGITSAVFNNDLIMGFKGNGTSCLRVWSDQSSSSNLVKMTASSGTLPARAWIVAEYKRRLFAAGDVTAPDTLTFSAAGDRTLWSGTGDGKGGTIVIGTENDKDPQGITAIMPGINGEPALYVAKRNSLYKVDMSSISPDNWVVYTLSTNLGVVNPNAYCVVDQDDICFMSDRGIHLLSQILSGTDYREGSFLSAPIFPDFQSGVDLTYKDRVNLTWYPPLNSILVSVKKSGNATMDCIYAFNTEVGPSGQPYGWYRWTSVPCNFLWTRFNATTQDIELYGVGERDNLTSTDIGFVNKLNQARRYDFTTSTAIVTTLTTQNMYLDDYLFEKGWLGLGFIYRGRDNSTFDVQWYVDDIQQSPSLTFEQFLLGNFILGSSILGVGILGQVPLGVKPNIQDIVGNGHQLKASIVHNTADADMEIFGMIVQYEGSGTSPDAFRKVAV